MGREVVLIVPRGASQPAGILLLLEDPPSSLVYVPLVQVSSGEETDSRTRFVPIDNLAGDLSSPLGHCPRAHLGLTPELIISSQ